MGWIRMMLHLQVSLEKFRGVIEAIYSILVVSCIMWSSALDIYDVLYFIISFNITSIALDQYSNIYPQTYTYEIIYVQQPKVLLYKGYKEEVRLFKFIG